LKLHRRFAWFDAMCKHQADFGLFIPISKNPIK